MNARQNTRYLQRKRAEAFGEFFQQSVGLQWLLREMIKSRMETPMAYKPVQNESAHLTDKPARSAFKSKHAHKKGTETKRMKKAASYEKSKPGKTRS